MQDEIKFHTDRAMFELELASRSANPQAAQAHLGLSSLHLNRLRQLCELHAAGTLSHAAGTGPA